jgi:hypothetical protein
VGASIAQQCIRAGLLDEIHLDLVPVLLGDGVRLFDHLDTGPIELESTRVIEGAGVTHLTFRVVMGSTNRTGRHIPSLRDPLSTQPLRRLGVSEVRTSPPRG